MTFSLSEPAMTSWPTGPPPRRWLRPRSSPTRRRWRVAVAPVEELAPGHGLSPYLRVFLAHPYELGEIRDAAVLDGPGIDEDGGREEPRRQLFLDVIRQVGVEAVGLNEGTPLVVGGFVGYPCRQLDSARHHQDHVGADVLDALVDVVLGAEGEGDERDHGPYTDDDPQHGQARAHLVDAQGGEGRLKTLPEILAGAHDAALSPLLFHSLDYTSRGRTVPHPPGRNRKGKIGVRPQIHFRRWGKIGVSLIRSTAPRRMKTSHFRAGPKFTS